MITPYKIDVAIIGAPRTMTTKIIDVMSKHKNIITSDPKESKYFSVRYGDIKYFASHYSHIGIGGKYSYQSIVYSNPIDCNMEFVRDRIHLHNPNTKIIMGIRDPIYRTISHFGIHRFKLPPGRVCKSIWDELDRNLMNFNPSKFLSEGDFLPYCNDYGSCYVQQYFECSLYYNMYMKYFGHFENIYIYDYDKLKENFKDEYNKIIEFIGHEHQDDVDESSSSNSLSSYGCDWDFGPMRIEFQERYPEICEIYRHDLSNMSKIIGYDLNEKWRV